MTMGGKTFKPHSSRKDNNTILDVPWDHYTFDLPGDTDLQPALRKKVEILETTEGFCMFYPKQRPRRERRDKINRTDDFNLNLYIELEGRDPNSSFQTDASAANCLGRHVSKHMAVIRFRQELLPRTLNPHSFSDR